MTPFRFALSQEAVRQRIVLSREGWQMFRGATNGLSTGAVIEVALRLVQEHPERFPNESMNYDYRPYRTMRLRVAKAYAFNGSSATNEKIDKLFRSLAPSQRAPTDVREGFRLTESVLMHSLTDSLARGIMPVDGLREVLHSTMKRAPADLRSMTSEERYEVAVPVERDTYRAFQRAVSAAGINQEDYLHLRLIDRFSGRDSPT